MRTIFSVGLAFILLLAGAGGSAAGQSMSCDQGVLERAPFNRIVSLYGAHTENFLYLGGGERLIGIDGQSGDLPGADGKPVFSYHDDPERFLAARPDLVVIRPMIERGYPQLVQRLKRSGIAVVSMQPSSVSQLDAYWTYLGRLCGKEEQSEAMIQGFHSAVAEFKVLAASVQQPRRVYFEAIHGKMKTFTPTAMAIFALEAAGGINVAADAPVRKNAIIAEYGKERLLSHAHDIDVFLSQQGAMNRATVDQIMAEPGFRIIKAVKEGRVYLVDEKIVSRPTMRLIRGIYSIGALLYPDVYCEGGRRILKNTGLE